MPPRRPRSSRRGARPPAAPPPKSRRRFRLQAAFRVWVEINGHPFIGAGRARLLHEIDHTGSISAAARSLGMSYRKAWSAVAAMNTVGPGPVAETATGGSHGGGARLTVFGKQILTDFHKLERQLQMVCDREKPRATPPAPAPVNTRSLR